MGTVFPVSFILLPLYFFQLLHSTSDTWLNKWDQNQNIVLYFPLSLRSILLDSSSHWHLLPFSIHSVPPVISRFFFSNWLLTFFCIGVCKSVQLFPVWADCPFKNILQIRGRDSVAGVKASSHLHCFHPEFSIHPSLGFSNQCIRWSLLINYKMRRHTHNAETFGHDSTLQQNYSTTPLIHEMWMLPLGLPFHSWLF